MQLTYRSSSGVSQDQHTKFSGFQVLFKAVTQTRKTQLDKDVPLPGKHFHKTFPVELTIFDNFTADKVDVAKELMVVQFAIGQAFLLEMLCSQKRLLAFGAYKMLQDHSVKTGM